MKVKPCGCVGEKCIHDATENPTPVDDYTLKLELLLTDLLSVLRVFTCKHCSGAGCPRCEDSGYHPFARRAIKRIEETLRKEWVDADGR